MSKEHRNVKLTLQAEEEFLEIYLYGKENWGKERAELFIIALYERFRLLCNNPEIGRKRDEFYPGCRSWIFENYVIFYQIKDTELEIIGVIHGSKDINLSR
ncbi:type II toxin-antitoxin system RelE/ParE family toxin [Gloeocapsa sp. PCC 73106]|uniref:type II toxin-antitoxin system RelE/ParE family toxin n=1 Tax=Gloeocapsa sp. PCC 73106 TaxID=102232 RepID=UPI0002ACEBA7|nr:type II toxin-antitoxin system RelE/ParE family toxin [Gloeocapsa sp. PCC 73106]ELS00081.1 plasmid stabilization system protein [Gloeocapsa sp. PCC 73106]